MPSEFPHHLSPPLPISEAMEQRLCCCVGRLGSQRTRNVWPAFICTIGSQKAVKREEQCWLLSSDEVICPLLTALCLLQSGHSYSIDRHRKLAVSEQPICTWLAGYSNNKQHIQTTATSQTSMTQRHAYSMATTARFSLKVFMGIWLLTCFFNLAHL